MNKKNKLNVVSSEAGAATVESALVLTVFLLLIFGIIEFSLIIFKASSLVEATRAGARYLIVNDPVVEDLRIIDCGNLPEPSSCEGNPLCDEVVSLMQKFYEPLTASQIYVGYKCSSTGYDEAYFKIYEVQVSVKDAIYNFITPGILGMGLSITLPEFETTRISEDLENRP